MSTWTSKGLAFAFMIGLGGCETLPLPQLPIAAPKATIVESNSRAQVAGLVVQSPKLYCLDKSAMTASTVVMFPCKALGEPAEEWPEAIAVITTSVGRAVRDGSLGDAAQMKAFFESDEGRTVLSRTNVAQSVTVLGTWAQPEAFYVRLKDTSATPFGKGYGVHWRAVTVVNGNSVTLTVGGYGKNSLDEKTGLKVLQNQVATLRKLNSGDGAS